MMNTDAPDVADSNAGESRSISLTIDTTLDLLSNRRRRYVLYHLRERGCAVTLEELAEQVASWESDTGETPNEAQVRADLYHSQLPRLDDAGAVTFDAEEDYATLQEDELLAEYLDLAAREDDVL